MSENQFIYANKTNNGSYLPTRTASGKI